MPRKRMDPAIRKSEFIDTATRLFIRKGYKKTSLRDILKAFGGETNVSPSVFYYYFKSKDELLDDSLNSYVDRYADDLIEVINDKNINYAEKMEKIIARVDRAVLDFHRMFLEEENQYTVPFHQLIVDRFFHRIVPHLAELIQDGLACGLLPVTPLSEQISTETLAWLLCNGIMTIFHSESEPTDASAHSHENMERLPAFIAQLLGVPLSIFGRPE
ncbi:MAG: TetR/AcrR family transcriptional regulator [Ethanoligenens sp.]